MPLLPLQAASAAPLLVPHIQADAPFPFGQVSVKGNQLTKPSRYDFPGYGVLFLVVMIGEVNPLAVMVYKAAFPIQVGVRVAADAIFLFEKCNSRI